MQLKSKIFDRVLNYKIINSYVPTIIWHGNMKGNVRMGSRDLWSIIHNEYFINS